MDKYLDSLSIANEDKFLFLISLYKSANIEIDLHKDLKRQMVEEETTFQEYVLKLIERDRSSMKVGK
ncbi:MAG: hypothetical protein ACRC6T_06690 [Sarcina sp.]